MNTLLATYQNDTYRLLADAMPDIVWTAKPNGVLDYCNKKWYDFTGFSEEADLRSGWIDTLHPDDRERCVTRWNQSLRTQEPYDIEYRFLDRRTPGTFRWFLGRALPLKDKQGNVLKWIGTCTDIDEMKRTQDALRDTQEMLDRAFNGARIGTWDWDMRKNELACHGTVRELYDLDDSVRDISLEHLLERILPEDRDAMYQASAVAITEGLPYYSEYRVKRKDGGIRWLASKANAQRASDGSPLRMSGIVADITDRKTIELALAESRAKLERSQHELQTLSDNLPDIVTRMDRNRNYLFVNAAVERMSGKTADALVGKSYRDLGMPETLCALFDENLDAVFASGEERAHEYVHPGMNRWFHSRLVPERDAAGTLVSVLVVSRDITERKEAELSVLRSREQLKIIADTAPVYLAQCDTAGCLKFVNKAYAERFGLQPEDCVGKTIPELLGHDAYKSVARYMNLAFAGQRVEFETVVPYDAVGKQYMHCAYAPEFDSGGNVVGLVASISNVTERRLAEQALKELEQRLQEANEKDTPGSAELRNNIVINHARGFRNVMLSDISHLEAVQSYCVIHTVNGEKIMSSRNLAAYEKLLHGKSFQRVHRSYIVNLTHFSALKTKDGSVAVLTNGVEIPVSRRLVKSLLDAVKVKS